VIWGSGIGLETFQIEMLNFAAGDGTQNLILSLFQISDIACGHISIKYGFRGLISQLFQLVLLLQMQLLTLSIILD
jgi:hypothetical protein